MDLFGKKGNAVDPEGRLRGGNGNADVPSGIQRPGQAGGGSLREGLLDGAVAVATPDASDPGEAGELMSGCWRSGHLGAPSPPGNGSGSAGARPHPSLVLRVGRTAGKTSQQNNRKIFSEAPPERRFHCWEYWRLGGTKAHVSTLVSTRLAHC